jgi:hypothetical protein
MEALVSPRKYDDESRPNTQYERDIFPFQGTKQRSHTVFIGLVDFYTIRGTAMVISNKEQTAVFVYRWDEENAWKKIAIIVDRPYGWSVRNRDLHVAGEWPSIRIGFCVCEELPANSCKVNTYHIDIGGNVTMYTPIQEAYIAGNMPDQPPVDLIFSDDGNKLYVGFYQGGGSVEILSSTSASQLGCVQNAYTVIT